MNVENVEALKESLKKKGFGESLNQALEENISAGEPDFTLEHIVEVKSDEVGYRLHFRNDEGRDKTYFNSFDTAILKSPDLRGIREHNFAADKMITAMEAYRMVKYGELVAVNKDLYNKEGQKYNVWLSIDVNGPKDEYNNYPVNSYHENYYKKHPFILADVLSNMPVPVKELETPGQRADIEKALKKANLPAVTMFIGGKEVNGFLSVDPKLGRINLLDSKMQIIDLQEQQRAQVVTKNTEQVQGEDVKKKTWPDRKQGKVNWPARPKGMKP
ncbi:hypothetical protein [Dinghuibacter silviterrae]|uniref:Uncharacterized protein n=1 Tax=Dinghuibacter silviterrae TaxID=1539049 RepID=A0A4R8DSX7_9BACT|nr:hypothetical protein [Dinghuibacter silviterrae]TDX00515.1 hypothetical protein EDB95_1540 [Dinghuibacter silviterrae]